jgi:hypothetical protein
MTVSSPGAISWTPRLPMFDEQLVVHYAIGMVGVPAPGVDRTITVTAPGRPYPLRRTGIEIPVKPNGLVAADLDGDGVSELLVAGRLGLFELAHVAGGYAGPRSSSPPPPRALARPAWW